jgi:hypothetical protein
MLEEIKKERSPGETIIGFGGVGEYMAIFDEGFKKVGPLRYRQLQYNFGAISK